MSASLKDFEGMSGAELIGIERSRQIEDLEYDAAHDDCHLSSELAIAGICYALAATSEHVLGAEWVLRGLWPWSVMELPVPAYTMFGNDDEACMRQLIKAGALLAAEIDRRLRLRQDTERASSFGDELEPRHPADKGKLEAAHRAQAGGR